MTLRELALYLRGYDRRFRKEEELYTMTAWLSASLQRARRIPGLRTLLGKDKARVLPPDEAVAEKVRHSKLIDQLAPGAAATEDMLRAFVEKHDPSYKRRSRAPAVEG